MSHHSDENVVAITDNPSTSVITYDGLVLPQLSVTLTRLPLAKNVCKRTDEWIVSDDNDSSSSSIISVRDVDHEVKGNNRNPTTLRNAGAENYELPPPALMKPSGVYVKRSKSLFKTKSDMQKTSDGRTSASVLTNAQSHAITRAPISPVHQLNKYVVESKQKKSSITKDVILPLPVDSKFRIPKKHILSDLKRSHDSPRNRRHHQSDYNRDNRTGKLKTGKLKNRHPYDNCGNFLKRREKKNKSGAFDELSSSHRHDLPKQVLSSENHSKSASDEEVDKEPKRHKDNKVSSCASVLEVEKWLNDNPVGEKPNAAGEVPMKMKPPASTQPVLSLPSSAPKIEKQKVDFRAHSYSKGSSDELVNMDVDELIIGINQFRQHIDCDSDAVCGPLTQLRSQLREEPMIIDEDESPVVGKKLFVVLDTNVLVSELYTVDEIMRSRTGEDDSWEVVLIIPWMVLQELDGLKNNRDAKCAHLREMAAKAVRYLHDLFTNCHPQVRGQPSYESIEEVGLEVESNDDRILHCCLLYSKKAGGNLILFSNDKNLCNKAMVHQIKAHTKDTIKDALETLAPTGSNNKSARSSSDDLLYGQILREMKVTLLGILEVIVKTEMEEVYGDMWTKIVIISPPYSSLMNVFACLKKHWIAVFGHCVKRNAKIHLDLMIQKMKLLNNFLNHDTVKSLVIESLQFLSFFEQRPLYNSKLKLAVVTLRGFLHQIKGDAVIVTPKTQPVQAQPNGNASLDDSSAVGVPQQDESPPAWDKNECELPADPIVTVQSTFEAVWSSINYVCGCLFDSFNLPNPVSYNRPSVLPTPMESYHFLPRFFPVITEIRNLLQRLLQSPSDTSSSNEVYLNLCSMLDNYFINLTLVSETKTYEHITPEMLQFYCTYSDKRELLGRGLEQLEEFCAYVFRLILMVKDLNDG